jgi:cell division inhibitor SepF
MGFMDELKKLTQPYEDDDDFFEGADVSFKPQPKAEEQPKANAQMVFENSFIAEETPAPESQSQKAQNDGGGFFSNLGIKKPVRQKSANRERTVNFGGKEQQVILFSPKSFDEAGELVNYMLKNLTVVMTLESVPTDMARRLLDFLSGIAFALQGKITPVSAKTYFITPQNVDILGVNEQQSQPETGSHYF